MVLLVFSIILMPYCILTSTGMSTRVHHITAQMRFIWSLISLTAVHVSYHIYCHNAKANIARIERTQRRRQHMSLTRQSVMMSSFFFVSLHSLTSTTNSITCAYAIWACMLSAIVFDSTTQIRCDKQLPCRIIDHEMPRVSRDVLLFSSPLCPQRSIKP